MYDDFENNEKREESQDKSFMTGEQNDYDREFEKREALREKLKLQESQRKAERKAARRKFWVKVGTGTCVGLAFGLVAGVSFAGINRVIDLVFPRTVIEQHTEEKEEKQIESMTVMHNQTDSADDNINVDSDKDYNKNSSANVSSGVGMGVSELVKNSMPAIVSITNKSVQEVRSMFGMGVREYESTSAGSGIIIGQEEGELLIVTNNHVIEGASSLTVGFADDEVYTAYVKGGDADVDLAIVSVKLDEVKDSTKDAIKIAVLGDSDELEVGEQVVAIGNALGYGQSVTTGIVSALDRDLTNDNVDNPLIQTDAAINPGNSGGALFNMRGELVGINCAKISSTSIEGVGYAIPISSATSIIETLMSRVSREEVDEREAGYIGISGASVDGATSEMYGIPQGVFVQNVEEGSPAEKAGLMKGDVLRKFDGITVSSIADVRKNLNYYRVGEKVNLIVYRQVDGEYVEKALTIELGSREGTALDPDNKVEETEDAEENVQEEETEEEAEEGKNYGDGWYEFDLEDFFNMLP